MSVGSVQRYTILQETAADGPEFADAREVFMLSTGMFSDSEGGGEDWACSCGWGRVIVVVFICTKRYGLFIYIMPVGLLRFDTLINIKVTYYANQTKISGAAALGQQKNNLISVQFLLLLVIPVEAMGST